MFRPVGNIHRANVLLHAQSKPISLGVNHTSEQRAILTASRGWRHSFLGGSTKIPTGFPDLTRAGVVRWLVRLGRNLHWFDHRSQAVDFARAKIEKPEEAESMPKSVNVHPGHTG